MTDATRSGKAAAKPHRKVKGYRRSVLVSNTAATMISSLVGASATKAKAAIKTIEADIKDPTKVRKLDGYDNVFVARGHGMRVVFKTEGESSVITAVSAEG